MSLSAFYSKVAAIAVLAENQDLKKDVARHSLACPLKLKKQL